MRRSWPNAWLLTLSAVVAGACAEAPDAGPPHATAEAAGALLTPPPTPPSGNVYDATTYLGPVAVGGSVQTFFTTDPQYYSFGLAVPANSQIKLEVTHLGSSMGLDTSLFLYGPKDASGSYGATPVAFDDDAGYGALSRITLVTLAAGGDYLAVVTSPGGAGKKFRLQVDCMGFACLPQPPPPPPADHHLALVEEPITPELQAQLAAANVYDGMFSYLRRFDFGWPYGGAAELDQAARAVFNADDRYRPFRYDPETEVLTYDEFLAYMHAPYRPLHPALLSTYGAPGGPVQVKRFSRTYSTGPNGDHWDSLFVILFADSHKIVVYEQQTYEI
jgi:hypothetical protein